MSDTNLHNPKSVKDLLPRLRRTNGKGLIETEADHRIAEFIAAGEGIDFDESCNNDTSTRDDASKHRNKLHRAIAKRSKVNDDAAGVYAKQRAKTVVLVNKAHVPEDEWPEVSKALGITDDNNT